MLIRQRLDTADALDDAVAGIAAEGRHMGNDNAIAWSQPTARRAGLHSLEAPDQVLRAILRRETEGLPLNHAAVLCEDRALYNAMRRFFGTWDMALRAAGLDPKRVRRHRRWDRQAVVRRIRQRAAEGLPLYMGIVERTECTLPSAALRWFGSWSQALEAAGIDPGVWAKRVPKWTPQGVVKAIRTMHARRAAVGHTALKRNSITRAGIQFFGNWDAALHAAGLDPRMFRDRRTPWKPDEVLDEIRRKARAGEPLNAKNVSPYSLRRRGRVFFGSWDAALTVAGLDPAKVRKNTNRGNRRIAPTQDSAHENLVSKHAGGHRRSPSSSPGPSGQVA